MQQFFVLFEFKKNIYIKDTTNICLGYLLTPKWKRQHENSFLFAQRKKKKASVESQSLSMQPVGARRRHV